MSLAPMRCSGVLSTIKATASRKVQANCAALDRYSLIRNFFRSQVVAPPPAALPIPPRHHTTSSSTSLVAFSRKMRERKWSMQSHVAGSLCDLRVQVRLQKMGIRPLGQRVSAALGFQTCPGSARWIHQSMVRLEADRPHDQLASPAARPQTSETSSSRPENPSTSKQNDDAPTASHTPGDSNNAPSQQAGHQHQVFDPANPPRHLENYPRLFRRLAMSLPHLHRPTRDDFLNVATGFWQRLRIRFKWFTIKSFRKFNADDISAFVTWFLMSQTLWILVGTTTFFSVIFAIANSLRLQHYVARAISDYLTSETGVTIIFESAIVPKWRESRISFKNVYVSRRPEAAMKKIEQQRRKNEHLTAAGYDVGNHPGYHRFGDDEDETAVPLALDEEDLNMSLFDLTIDSVDVTLSLWRWLDGKGLVEDAVVKGVRGVLDRRNVYWDPDNPPDPALFRHKSVPGDFELESLQLEDVLITVHQPGSFRPYTASIFRADMRQFRKRWLFYDFLCAENVVGQFDNCLFSLHKPQSIGRTTEKDLENGEWARMSRIRIDGVNIDHLQNSTTMEGPISWITSGKVDAVLDIKFPRDPHDDLPFNAILGEIADAITTSLNSATNNDPELQWIPGQRVLARPPLSAPPSMEDELHDGGRGEEGEEGPKVVIDIDLRFRDLKAAVPIFTNDLSYVNNAFIRPIVAFMNANRTLVPIHCRVAKDLSDFDGSWTMWETGLMDEISIKTYDALAYHVSQANMNRQRMKTVSLWSLQKTASAILGALKNIADPVSAHLKEAYLSGQQGMNLALYDTVPMALGVDV